MNRWTVFLATALVAVAVYFVAGADSGRPPVDAAVIPPARVMDSTFLYARNCAGCHGPDGKSGVAIGIGDPIYLAIADDATITRITADGVQGTAMPAFAERSGGMLTDDQINVIVRGMRARWARPDAVRDVELPPYAAQSAGDPKHGADVYGTYCSSCHGAEGHGATRAGSIVDGSYLALVSDQNLRTTIITGRPELGAPDWRGDVPGKPMSPDDISDVVAWLAAQRQQFPGQPYLNALQSGPLQAQGGIR
jgi:mono/diheme cytochrome c family protein